jgi:sialate O-acetylesterase
MQDCRPAKKSNACRNKKSHLHCEIDDALDAAGRFLQHHVMIHDYRKLAAIGVALCLAGCNTPPPQPATVPAPAVQSDVRVPRLFSDNMVLQQGTSAPIWGWAEDGAVVTVKFRNEVVSARAQNGKWLVQLHNLKPGGPDILTISAANTLEFTNVLVGEVWVASGQSNMEFPLKSSFEAADDIASAANPMIHFLKVPHTRLNSPTNDIHGNWTEASPATVSNISAVAYYFARDLHAKLRVPIGIIESDWGGTPAEAWMEFNFLHDNPHWENEIIKEWAVQDNRYQRNLEAFEDEKRQAQENNTAFNKRPPSRPWKPAELYNGMIAPLVPYAIKGVIWYQGESNADSPDRAEQYHTLFPGLISDWRSVWGEGDFPFLLVQLAPYMDIQKQPSQSAWASLREAQLDATKVLPNVGMAVITDVGMEHNIHPTKKKPVGDRLALAARAIAYHEPIEYSGPAYKEMRIEGSHIVLTFDHVGGGLEARDGDLTGFAIAGPDEKFYWAVARIQDSDKVIVNSPEVQNPVAVRFGWANYPVVNLWNKAGLPASPFRTDDFAK